MHQITLRKKVPFISGKPSITEKELDDRVKAGAKLVLLDDLVLDVSGFIAAHPGGKFLIEHNVGKDVSKFFYTVVNSSCQLKIGNLSRKLNMKKESTYVVNVIFYCDLSSFS